MHAKVLSMLMAGLLYLLLPAPALQAADKEVLVFAAASTTNAITDIAKIYEEKNKASIKSSFASSSTLAKQIESGAPADIFISANINWMDYLAERNLIMADSRRDLLGNTLVFIVPADSAVKSITVDANFSPLDILGKDGRLSVGDPEHVPAGMYGKTAMEKLGYWDKVKDRLAPMKDVRAALALVERGEAPLGIVYGSDAAISDKVRIAGIFPADSHPAVLYPAALLKEAKPEAKAFLDFLQSAESRAIFAKYGFQVQ